MRRKTGPILVIGALVLLVGLALVLGPKPAPTPEETEQKAVTKPSSEEEEKQKTEETRLALDQLKQLLVVGNLEVQLKALDSLRELYVGSHGEAKDDVGRVIMDVARYHKDDKVRAGACTLLQLVDNADLKIVLQLGKYDRSPEVREAAIKVLANSPPGGPVEQTLRQFKEDSDPGIRSAATIALTHMLTRAGQGGAQELCTLLGQYDNDSSAQAAMALQQRGASALPPLIDTLYHSQSGPQREAAAMTIGIICAGYNPYVDQFAREALVTHRQITERRPANPAGVAPLIWALKNDRWPATREIAAQCLGYLGDARAVQPLARALRDSDVYVRRRAAAALMALPAAPAASQLADAATQDESEDVRRFAVLSLGAIGTPEVIPALTEACKDKSANVRRYAATELGRIADPSAVEALAAMLGKAPDPDPDVRWAAVVALGKIRDRRASDVLVQSLSDPSPQVANSAERALQKLGISRREEAGFEK